MYHVHTLSTQEHNTYYTYDAIMYTTWFPSLGNGVVEFPEFVDLMSRRPWGMVGSRDELVEAFSVFKSEGDENYVLAEQVRTALTSLGEKLTDEEVNEMFNQLVLDGEGKVDFNGECWK